jgi:formylglycine-generating enzyme required for sulfatase activity
MKKILISGIILAGIMAGWGCGKSEMGQNTGEATQPVGEVKGMAFIGTNPQGNKEYRHERTGMLFVLIKGSTFKMGSNKSGYEKPVHEVILDSFLISKYEVTQGVYQKIMNNNPARFKTGDDYPVEQVSWDDCQGFCKKAGLRLPTEAEWEYACKAGTNTKFYWGDKEDGDYMWYNDNSGNTTHPVGGKKPNGFGLYDMSGNVWEWCQDWYGENYYKDSPKNNPSGPANGMCCAAALGSAIRATAVLRTASGSGLLFGATAAVSVASGI